MKTVKLYLLFFSLTSQASWAKSSCDIYFQASQIQKSAESFDKIASFFGFQNGKKTFNITFIDGRETQYWTTQSGKALEQSSSISSYRGKTATLELNINAREDWSFKWTISGQGPSTDIKVSELIFESNLSRKNTIPDFVTNDGSKLVLTRSTVRKNPNSKVSIVINYKMSFLKKSDGSVELMTSLTNDSIRENTILIGEETEHTFNLKER